MSIVIERSGINFDEAPEEVFDLLADCSNEKDWNPDVLKMQRTSYGRIGAGSTFVAEYRGMGRMEITLDVAERPWRLAFNVKAADFDLRMVFGFGPRGAGTTMAVRIEIAPRKLWMRIFGPLVKVRMLRAFSARPEQMRRGLELRRGALRRAS